MQIERNVYLNKLIARKHNGFVKVITGIRRCGKSYLLNTLFYQHLLNSGVEDSHIIRFAFDSAQNLMLIGEDLMEIEEGKRKVDPEKFMTYINDKIVDDGMYYLLLDEVQNLGYFEAVLNGYLRKDNVDVYVTGSNSKFLSSDIITEFAGRGDEVHVLPLSFSEFFSVYDGSKEEAFDDYMVYGGLPSVALMQTEEQKVAYLNTQITNVYLRDIVKRYHLQSDEDIGELLDILASGISTLVNPRKLAGTFKSVKGSTISEVTVAKYIGHMAESFLISKAKRYDACEDIAGGEATEAAVLDLCVSCLISAQCDGDLVHVLHLAQHARIDLIDRIGVECLLTAQNVVRESLRTCHMVLVDDSPRHRRRLRRRHRCIARQCGCCRLCGAHLVHADRDLVLRH